MRFERSFRWSEQQRLTTLRTPNAQKQHHINGKASSEVSGLTSTSSSFDSLQNRTRHILIDNASILRVLLVGRERDQFPCSQIDFVIGCNISKRHGIHNTYQQNRRNQTE